MSAKMDARTALAWGVCAAAEGAGPGRCSLEKCCCGQEADAILQALAAHGYTVVPLEPTDEMVAAVMPMWDAFVPDSHWPFTQNLYRAMLAAK